MRVNVATLDTVEAGFDIFDTGRSLLYVPALEFQQLAGISSLANIWHASCICSIAEGHMFRISTIDTDRERRLIVEGTLVQPWVAELKKTWDEAGESLAGRTLVIDLTNATVISRDGEDAIFELMKQGAKFSCGGVLNKHVLKQLAHRCHTRLQDVLNRGCAKGSNPDKERHP